MWKNSMPLYVMIDVSNVLWCIHHQTGWGGGVCQRERDIKEVFA